MNQPSPAQSFTLHVPDTLSTPVILSIPHAGRHYPPAMAPLLRLPMTRLAALEDRHVDSLASRAIAAGVPTLIATAPRAWIDLNRHEDEVDPAMVTPPPASGRTQSAKVRGGLGLVPRRLAGSGDIWRGRLPAAALAERIAQVHRPYHAALAALIASARARFGVAVLLDLHSMPPIPDKGWGIAPRIVLGDRFGRSASSRFVMRLAAEAQASGLPVTENVPYSGGYILERHASPARNIHAIQLEIDRSLYLENDLRTLKPSAQAAMARMVAAMAAALADEALAGPQPLAAE